MYYWPLPKLHDGRTTTTEATPCQKKKHDADDTLFPTLGMPPPIIEYSFTQDTYVAAE